MNRGTCSRCGAEESMFWYPYAFGMAPIPTIADRTIDRAQYFTLCDKCQQEFTEFMHDKRWPSLDIDPDKLKELLDSQPLIIPTAEEYQ